MQKIMIIMLCALAMSATTAHAEHKLLITDVLAARQFEVEADFSYAHSSSGTTRKYPSFDATTGMNTGDIDVPGRQTRNTFSSIYSLGVGIGYGLQLNAAIPFVFVDNVKQEDNSDSRLFYVDNRKQDGVGDIALGVKYSLYENRARPLSVVTGLDVKLYTADSSKAGTGTNDIAPYIAASTAIHQNLKPYVSYKAVIRDHGAGNAHIVSAGAEYEMNQAFTLKPRFSAKFRTASDTFNAYDSYSLGLSSYVNLFSNFYLIPRFDYGISTSTTTKNQFAHFGTLRVVTAGLAMYYLFD